MRILVVEDEAKTADYLRQGLTESGWVVAIAENGTEALHLAREDEFDLIVLDVNLPGVSGWEVLQRLRADMNTPVLMLTARGSLSDKVKGFELGADDYLVKPFEFPELLARVRTLARRGTHSSAPEPLRIADLELEAGRHRALRSGARIDLTAREFALLHLLMRRAGEVLSRTQLASLVWDMNFDSDSNVVEVAIRRLRAKVDDPYQQKLIHTVRGVGYVLENRG